MQIFHISVDVHANEHPTLVALKLEEYFYEDSIKLNPETLALGHLAGQFQN